jgi:hypothetical protein
MNGLPAHGLYPDQQSSPGPDHIFSERNQRVDQTRLRPDFEAQMVYGVSIFSVFAAALLLLIFIWFLYSS